MAVRRIFVEKRQGFYDIPAQQMCQDFIESFHMVGLKAVRLITRYDIEGLSDEEYAKVRDVVFAEPPVDVIYENKLPNFPNSRMFAVEYLPGQYDVTADSAAQCVQLVTQKDRPVIRTARIIVLVGDTTKEDLERIKDYCINKVESREASLDIPDTLQMQVTMPPMVETLKGFGLLDRAGLEAFLNEKGLAMSIEDLEFCQQYFRDTEHRNPTITEIRVIDTYWSDHCRHTTFTTVLDSAQFAEGKYTPAFKKAYKMYQEDREILYRDKPRDMTLMDIAVIGAKALKKQGLLDDLDESEEINACSIVVNANVGGHDEKWLVMFKNETHNHPTEIEPFGGAATCLGGAIRDPLSGRSYVYQAMRVTGSGDPRTPVRDTLPGKLPQRKITRGAAAGYSSYGNQIGLATGEVHEVYHPGYVAKRLEIGAVVAAAPAENVVRERPLPGDAVLLVGGRTGRDGIGGATGSSKEHTEDSINECGSEVQKGNPPTERKLQRLFRDPSVSRMIKRCNDFGAGGVAVAIGELAPGLHINLDAVKKKYEGLDGTELAISESQERMAVVVSPEDVEAFVEAADKENLETSKVAVVTDDSRLVMEWRGREIVRMTRAFLDTNGVRQHADAYVAAPDEDASYLHQIPECVKAAGHSLEKAWLDNMSQLNVCSQKGLSERFDSTIGGNSVLMPFGGSMQLTPAEGMAALLPVHGAETHTATAMTFGLDPYFMSWSPFHGAVYAVVDAAAKMVALGGQADRIRLTFQEYFESLGKEPAKWGKPFAALLGALYAQHMMKIPAIGGKDSMSGTFEDLTVPPTLAAFAVDVVDADKVISPEFKFPGSKVYVIPVPHDSFDLPAFQRLNMNFQKVGKLISEKKVLSASTVGIGGIAAAVSKMALGNNIGFTFETIPDREKLYAPAYGTLIIEVVDTADLSEALEGTGFYELGHTMAAPSMVCGQMVATLKEVREAYTKPLEKIFPTCVKTSSRLRATYMPYTEGPKTVAAAKIAKPHVFIPVFPGTNCEYDSARAFERAGGETETVIVRNLTPTAIEETVDALVKGINRSQILMLPGGFSGADEPDGSGKFIAAMFRNPRIEEAIMHLLYRHDGLILGICNGFQALIKLGLVPYGEIRPLSLEDPTLTYNTLGRHVSTMVRTKIVSNLSPWLAGCNVGDEHMIAVSHGEGRFVADKNLIAKLRMRGQIATQYVDGNGKATTLLPDNPNGSVEAVEGITSPDGRVLGKMGHSERIGENVGRNIPGSKDQHIFESGIAYYA